MRTAPLIRVHPVSSRTPMRLIASSIGRVFTPPGGGVRVIEMRLSRQGAKGQPVQACFEVTDTMSEIEAMWPGFARLQSHANDGGLHFLLNTESVAEYAVMDTKDGSTGKSVGEAVGVYLDGRAAPILAGEYWGEADQKIMAARLRADLYYQGEPTLPDETPDAGLVMP